MRRELLWLIFVALMILPALAPAQCNVIEAGYKTGEKDLDKVLGKGFFYGIRNKYMDTCFTAAGFVKFTLDSAGNVKEVVFSSNSGIPKPVRAVLAKVIYSTDGNWLPRSINGKPVTSRPFILPVIYDMEATCHFPGASTAAGTVPNTLNIDLRYMFEFEDGSKPYQLNCVLLRPLLVFSGGQ